MAFILRQDKRKKGIYLQMYENYWDKQLKQPRNKCIESFGYVDDLVSNEIPDPVAYYQNYVKQLNEKRNRDSDEKTRPKAFTKQVEFSVGHFLLCSLIDELGVKKDIDILASVRRFQFSIFDLLSQLIYARVLYPCSKAKTVSTVFPSLFNSTYISEDQVYDGIYFIGNNCKKYIELFNYHYAQTCPRNFNNVYFDCTNYYFEIDLPHDDLQKGCSKENRTEPIIGQALLLDADLIPLSMQMYPGNESEKPYIRKIIEEMKTRNKVKGRTVQVADKGLNCARNIYSAVKEANDGYIFSKSVHGTNLCDADKKWVLLEDENNVFEEFRDKNGKLLFKLKTDTDIYDYSFEEIDPETGTKKNVRFQTKEKRIVSYNPSLAAKRKAEILKMVDKASSQISYKSILKSELGDSSKYIKITNTDKAGNKINPRFELNTEAIEDDLKFAGYNMIVTSEINMSPLEVYKTYHSLWKIEESFRITKSYLDARPVFLQKKESIYGHFLVCYLALFLIRILELKCFSDSSVNAFDLISFMQDFKVADCGDDRYLNLSQNQKLNLLLKDLTGFSFLDAAFLTKKEINSLFQNIDLLPF